jgi:type I restriction enzyme, S subunit
MQRYESYKPSGVKWLGDVPAHWEVQSLRAVTSLKSDKNRPDLPVLSVYRDYGVILKDSRDDNHNATSLDTSTYKVVKPGDLVVNKMKAWQGSMGVSAHNGIVSPAYITCTTNADRVRPAYLHYLLRSSPLIGVYNSLSYGVRVGQWDMHYEDFKQIQIPLPPEDEQDRIVSFLDQKTAEIDAAIAKKERLIELLAEQRSILIRNAVTRGLSSSAAMCDSGVTWLGAIPAHWELKPLKRLVDFIGGGTPNKNTAAFWNGDIPWVSPKDMKQEKISRSHDYITNLALNKTSVKLIQVGAVLVVVRGMILSRIFPAAVTELPVTINQDMKGLIPKKWIDSEFLRYVLSGHEAHTLDLTEESGHGTKTMPTDKLGAFPVVVPPLAEQIEIRKHCHEISASVEKVIEKTRRQLTQLQELKVTLVAVSVLGKASL